MEIVLLAALTASIATHAGQAAARHPAATKADATPGCQSLLIDLREEMCLRPGRTVMAGALASPVDVALDAFCADILMKRAAPNGIVSVFGSARFKAEDSNYKTVRNFAAQWTHADDGRFPIATGGGSGLMEAANRGAREAGGRSIGLFTHFGPVAVERTANEFTTDSYKFASFAQREAELVDRARAIIIAPGGFGTEWELFETVSKVQTGKKEKVPIILLGPKSEWASLLTRIEEMKKEGTIAPQDIALLQFAETPEEAVAILQASLLTNAAAPAANH